MKAYAKDVLDAAQRHAGDHRAELEESVTCGCFYCRKTFAPAEIREWANGDDTALCPRCGIDSVIGSASGLPVQEPAFLGAMHRRWF